MAIKFLKTTKLKERITAFGKSFPESMYNLYNKCDSFHVPISSWWGFWKNV